MEIKTRKFTRSKNTWENEEIALADVMHVQDVPERILKAAHTDTQFVWTTEVDGLTGFPVLRIAIADVEEKRDAIHSAMKCLDTFEGNLRTEHTETEYVFTKVRG